MARAAASDLSVVHGRAGSPQFAHDSLMHVKLGCLPQE